LSASAQGQGDHVASNRVASSIFVRAGPNGLLEQSGASPGGAARLAGRANALA
jgi:hypothetical protein